MFKTNITLLLNGLILTCVLCMSVSIYSCLLETFVTINAGLSSGSVFKLVFILIIKIKYAFLDISGVDLM